MALKVSKVKRHAGIKLAYLDSFINLLNRCKWQATGAPNGYT